MEWVAQRRGIKFNIGARARRYLSTKAVPRVSKGYKSRSAAQPRFRAKRQSKRDPDKSLPFARATGMSPAVTKTCRVPRSAL